MEDKKLHTGTTTVGVVCKDGIVLAADKRASAGYFVASKDMNKIQNISSDIAVTMAGLVSDAQLTVGVLDNDSVQLTISEAGTINEGDIATFNVSLGSAVDNATTLTFDLGEVDPAETVRLATEPVSAKQVVSRKTRKRTRGAVWDMGISLQIELDPLVYQMNLSSPKTIPQAYPE